MIFFGLSNQNYINIIELARPVIENTYNYLCDVIEYQAIQNIINKRTEYQEIKVLEKQPCRISYQTISKANKTENESNITQIVKLFIAPEIQLKPRFKNYSNKRQYS